MYFCVEIMSDRLWRISGGSEGLQEYGLLKSQKHPKI